MFIQIDQRTLILKNGGNKGFSYETKASMSFVLMMRISLWSLIMKRKGIIILICTCPNSQMDFNSRNGGKRSFSYETKALTSFILIRRMTLWCPIMKKNESII